jgi:hypothetical protein
MDSCGLLVSENSKSFRVTESAEELMEMVEEYKEGEGE